MHEGAGCVQARQALRDLETDSLELADLLPEGFAPVGITRGDFQSGARQYETESRLRLFLQRAGRAAGGGGALSPHRLAALAHDRECRDEPVLRLGDLQCAQIAMAKALREARRLTLRLSK